MAYLTSDIDGIIAGLEAGMKNGVAEVTHEGKRIVYRNVEEILRGITYFKSLYDNATDATSPATPKVRTYLMFGGQR